jgi:hypothetical protein
MPDAISPEALPGWPYKDLEAEEATLLACLLGKHVTRHQDEVNEQPLTGVFGHVMLSWETLRHDETLVELLTKLQTPPTDDDWKNDPDFSTLFPAPQSYIIWRPGFPGTPFLSLEATCQNQLIELFTPGQPALEIGNIEMLDAMGVLERFKQLVTLAKEGRLHKQPEERFKQDAILKRENLNPGESVYDAVFAIRPHMGIEKVREDFQRWLRDNSKLFPNIDMITMRQREDPRQILHDLAILRLVKLYGYDGASDWTKKHRPHKGIGGHKSDYERYFGEGKKPKGRRPIYERQREVANAVRRALDAITSQKLM